MSHAGESISAAEFNRSRGSARAVASGKGFEELLEDTHRAYRLEGLANIHKLPVETAPAPKKYLSGEMQKRAGVMRILAQRQRADYFGWLLEGARAVLMEAKATSKPAASLAIVPKGVKSGSGLKEHQLAGLVEAHRQGALVAVVWDNGGERCVISGAMLEHVHTEHRMGRMKRIPRAACDPYEIRSGQGAVRVEAWLEAALRSE